MFKFQLVEFINSVYDINPLHYSDFSKYDFNHSEMYKQEFYSDKIQQMYPTLNNNQINEAIREAKINHYENSYIGQFYIELCKQLEFKILEDFKILNEKLISKKFFCKDNGELEIENSIAILKLDWQNDIIEFEGGVDDLARFEINCVNAYGMFYYESLQDFYDAYPVRDENSKLEWVTGHLHWLRKFEDIYGTIYNIFKFDTKHIDYYGILGDGYKATEEEICEYIEDNFDVSRRI